MKPWERWSFNALHMVVAATSVSLAGLILLEGDAQLVASEWGPRVGSALAFGAAYWATTRSKGRLTTTVWLVVQAGFIAWFVYLIPPDPGESQSTKEGQPTAALFITPSFGVERDVVGLRRVDARRAIQKNGSQGVGVN